MQPNHISSNHERGAKLIVDRTHFLQHQAGHPDHQAFFW
jgi:hypothetical protein